MSVRIDKGRLGAGLEMTPLIDVVFLLMIFFLVASRLEEADRVIDVVLPEASAAKPLTSRTREFVINIDRTGAYHAGARPVDLTELERLLRQAAADQPVGQTVILRADEDVPHKFVVGAMNACVLAGIDDYHVQSVTTADSPRP
ncbi:MAG: biopolymer transporter ExbD [Planctomycetia bacterium]|nr:biopolymer transporter ExbD [Planctomycetia bacterium]